MRTHHKGFSVIELLVALAVAGLASTAIYGVFVSQNRAYLVTQQISEAQYGGRNSLAFMVDMLRMTGFALPRDYAFVGSGVSDNVAPCGADQIAFQARNPVGGYKVVAIPDENTVTVDAADALAVKAVADYPASLNFANIPIFLYGRAGRMTLAEQGTLPIDGSVTATFSAAQTGIADGVFQGPRAYIAAVDRHSFYIDFCDTGFPTLMYRLNNQTALPLAPNIEDLQFAFFVDKLSGVNPGPDGIADDLNAPLNSDISDADLMTVKAVRISLVARSETEPMQDELSSAGKLYLRPALENHGAGTTADGYRRRVYSSLVLLPNMRTADAYANFPNEF